MDGLTANMTEQKQTMTTADTRSNNSVHATHSSSPQKEDKIIAAVSIDRVKPSLNSNLVSTPSQLDA